MFSLICALNKRLGKQSQGWWFEMPTHSLWRHCNASISAPTAEEVLSNLKHDYEISLRSYRQYNVVANKFQFLISSPYLKIRICKYLPLNCKMLIFMSFMLISFTYCPIVWHFCGKQNNRKVEKIHERALRILNDDYDSECTELLTQSGTTTMLHSRFKCFILEVSKSMQGINLACIQDMFDIKKIVLFSTRFFLNGSTERNRNHFRLKILLIFWKLIVEWSAQSF